VPASALVEIDEAWTAHAKAVLRLARDRIAHGKVRDLTLEDCNGILGAVAVEIDGT